MTYCGITQLAVSVSYGVCVQRSHHTRLAIHACAILHRWNGSTRKRGGALSASLGEPRRQAPWCHCPFPSFDVGHCGSCVARNARTEALLDAMRFFPCIDAGNDFAARALYFSIPSVMLQARGLWQEALLRCSSELLLVNVHAHNQARAHTHKHTHTYTHTYTLANTQRTHGYTCIHTHTHTHLTHAHTHTLTHIQRTPLHAADHPPHRSASSAGQPAALGRHCARLNWRAHSCAGVRLKIFHACITSYPWRTLCKALLVGTTNVQVKIQRVVTCTVHGMHPGVELMHSGGVLMHLGGVLTCAGVELV